MLAHVLGGEGKRLRPALALLAGKFGDYDLTSLVPLAASIELLHSATLVHDDVIDEAPLRRGRETSNGLFGNAASVMLGDFMFAHAPDFIASTGSVRLVRLFSKTIMSIATGELQQDISAFDYGKGIRDYFGRIAGKTASLFGTACEGGAIASACPEPWIDALREYGFNLGMAFQIVDDILDAGCFERARQHRAGRADREVATAAKGARHPDAEELVGEALGLAVAPRRDALPWTTRITTAPTPTT